MDLVIRLVMDRLIHAPSQGIDEAHPRSLRSNRDRIRADSIMGCESGLVLQYLELLLPRQ